VVKGGALHIVRRRADALATAMIEEQSLRGRVGVVLVQDGIFADMPASAEVYVNDEDVKARGVETVHRRVGYDEIARFVVDASTVMVW
jgi:sulfur transfer complex TusBCD TusB component (DsrH family)